MSSFTAADYVVCGTMLLTSAGIGVYFALTGGRQRSQAVGTVACTGVIYDRRFGPFD